MANRVVENMWRWSRQGALPIVCDASSCTLGLKQEVLDYLSVENGERHKALIIYGSITWADEKLPFQSKCDPEGPVRNCSPHMFDAHPRQRYDPSEDRRSTR
jgi:hypothetical protein